MTTPSIELSDVPYEATQVADWLTDGKPELGWRGDPRLSLRIGIVSAQRAGHHRGRYRRAGEVLGRNYQVFRHNEDGTDTSILSRRLDQWHEIIPALVQLDPRTPGHVPTMQRVERANAIEHKQRDDEFREAHGEATEHLWKLVADRQNGPSTFRQIPGRNPDKQE